MSKVLKTAVFIVVVVAGVVLLFRLQSTQKNSPSPRSAESPPSTAGQPPTPINLAEFCDDDPSFNAPGSSWLAVPRGRQILGGVPFQIDGLIELWGEGAAGMKRNYREIVEGLPATGKFQTLYALHGASFAAEEGTPIAGVVFRYADGSAATNILRYGTDSRDWWQPAAERNPMPTNSASKVIWRGDHPGLPDWVRALRLFGTGIANPKPDTEVKGVDLVSTKSRVTWVVLALTTGPSGLLKADPQLEQEDAAPAEEPTIVLTAVDLDTGKLIANVQFDVTLVGRRQTEPYGFFAADEKGEALVDLPPERLRRLAIQTSCEGYPPMTMSWDLEKGEKIPTNHVFKLSKKRP